MNKTPETRHTREEPVARWAGDCKSLMEKHFNVAGPCFPNRHYMLPALDRMPEIRRLVEQEMYFVIHAPRQTGKTTAVFDDDAAKSWDEKIFRRDETCNGKTIHIVGL